MKTFFTDHRPFVLFTVSDLAAAKLMVNGLAVLQRNILSIQKLGAQVAILNTISIPHLSSMDGFSLNTKSLSRQDLVGLASFYQIEVVDEDSLPQMKTPSCKLAGDVQYPLSFFKRIEKEGFGEILLYEGKSESDLSIHSQESHRDVIDVSDLIFKKGNKGAQKILSKKLFQEIYDQTEGWIARGFNKKISFPISKILVRTSVTPNQITLFAFFLGCVGCVLLISQGWLGRVVGAFLLQLSSVIDGCDGEVARLKLNSTRLGAWLDTISDDVLNNLMFVCLYLGLYFEYHHSLFLTVSIVTSIASLFVSFFLYHHAVKNDSPNVANYKLAWEKTKSPKNHDAPRSLFDKLKPVLKRDFVIFLVFLFVLFNVRLVLMVLFIPVWIAFFLYLTSFVYDVLRRRKRRSLYESGHNL